MLKIENVTVNFEKKEIGPFSTDIESDQIVAIIGSSGAGKTTLVKAITNTITDYMGQISYNNQQIDSDIFMYITQKGTLFQHLTIEENLKLTNYNEKEVKAIFNDLNLPLEYLNKYPFELSGAECQRIDLTRAILAQTKILVLDEAFSALDSKTKDDTYEILKRLQKEHSMLILFITHDLQEAVFLANEIILISDGIIEFQGSNKELIFSENTHVNNLISKEKKDLLRGAYANN